MQQVAMATGSGLGQAGGMQDPINALQNMAMSGAGMPPGQPPPGKSSEIKLSTCYLKDFPTFLK